MDSSDIAWAGIIAAGIAFETYALKNSASGDTLSEKTRKVFRVRTSRVGRLAFAGLWLSFAGWFLGHILWGWDFPLT